MHLFNSSLFKKFLYTPIRLNVFSKSSTIELMDRIDFIEQNEFHIKSRKLFGEPTTPTMISILLRTGIARNEKHALFILASVVLITLSLTFGIIYVRNAPASSTVTDQAGNTYTFEQYIELVRAGKDPLLPK